MDHTGTVYIFNTTVAPTSDLVYSLETISREQARDFLARSPRVVSAIGHEATAQIASAALGRDVPMNRITASMRAGDAAICVKLRERAPEGVILSREEVERIGFDLVLMRAFAPLHDLRATAIYVLAVLYHESERAPVAAGETLAAAERLAALPFVEWGDLPAHVQRGRRMTAEQLLARFSVGAPFPDLGAQPVGVEDLAAAIHEAERPAVEQGLVLRNLGRPWIPFDQLPAPAQDGRRRQARYLLGRAFIAPRS